MKFMKLISDSKEITKKDYDVIYYNETSKEVTFMASGTTPTPAIETVDLGITNAEGKKVLWCTCNIGASAPEEYGKYFQWGDTVGYYSGDATSHSTWSTAPFNDKNSSYSSTAWASHSASTVTKDSNGDYNLNAAYDAATVTYGSGYRLPTEAELKLLTANTSSNWETLNGVNGRRFTSKADPTKSIFIPAAGYAGNGSLRSQGSSAGVWSSSLYASYPYFAWRLSASSSYVLVDSNDRFGGYSARGVLVQN